MIRASNSSRGNGDTMDSDEEEEEKAPKKKKHVADKKVRSDTLFFYYFIFLIVSFIDNQTLFLSPSPTRLIRN